MVVSSIVFIHIGEDGQTDASRWLRISQETGHATPACKGVIITFPVHLSQTSVKTTMADESLPFNSSELRKQS